MSKETAPTKEKKAKDLIPRSEVLALIDTTLKRLKGNTSPISARETFALLNGISTDIKNIKGE